MRFRNGTAPVCVDLAGIPNPSSFLASPPVSGSSTPIPPAEESSMSQGSARSRVRRFLSVSSVAMAATLVTTASASLAAQKVTSPKEQFGFDIGDDYKLATYTQLIPY